MNDLAGILCHPLMLPITAALAAGLVAYVVSRWSPLICKLLALAAAAWTTLAGIWILRTGSSHLTWQWARITENIAFSLELAPNPLGMLVVIAGGAFTLLIAIYSLRAMAGEYWEGKFYAYLIWALGGSCLVGLADNLLVLLVGWEIVTLMLFLMVNQGTSQARSGAAKAYGMLGFADACLLMGVALLAGSGGSAAWSLSAGPVQLGQAPLGNAGYVVYVLILIAALAKAGAVPLHTWVPAIARDAPVSVMAYLPAAMDKLLGIYLLATLALRMFTPNWTMQVVMMVVGGVTIISAALMAMMQHNLKRLLSFQTVAQVGYMVLGLGAATAIGIIGGLFQMINCAIYNCGLFMMSGSVRRATGSDEIEDMGALARAMPVTFICGCITAASISGVPPFNGFVGKWLVYQGTLAVSAQSGGLAAALVVVAVFGSALTLASLVKVMYAAFLSPAPKATKRRPAAGESLPMVVPMVILAAACVVLGLAPQLLVSNVFVPLAKGYGAQVTVQGTALEGGGIGYWNPSQATWLILVGIFLGGALVWISTRRQRRRVVRPFLGGEVPAASDDRFRMPATDFYRTIAALPVIGALLAHGEIGAMDPYHWSSHYGHGVVEALRRMHTGLISLYVVWCLLGLTVTLVFLMVSSGS